LVPVTISQYAGDVMKIVLAYSKNVKCKGYII
jgi:hypothetical protein